MDLSELELDYIAHVAGQKVETHQQPPVADPIDQTVNLWKGADAQILSQKPAKTYESYRVSISILYGYSTSR